MLVPSLPPEAEPVRRLPPAAEVLKPAAEVLPPAAEVLPPAAEVLLPPEAVLPPAGKVAVVYRLPLF